jgi:N-acetylneuraminic acid mutarotase
MINTGGRYKPTSGTWTNITMTSAPAGRRFHGAVWTGTNMFVWGGRGSGGVLGDGARYDPVTDTWTALPSTGAPSAREHHTIVWTGKYVIVYGGYGSPDSNSLADGKRYDPALNSWSSIASANAPQARAQHTAVWTGTEMIVWGGFSSSSGLTFSDGARYNPTSDAWSAVSSIGSPTARYEPTSVWTGTEMIIWGGANYYSGSDHWVGDGGACYNPAGNGWTPMTMASAPPGSRMGNVAQWTGTDLLICGGLYGGYALANFVNDAWSYTSSKVMYLYQRP